MQTATSKLEWRAYPRVFFGRWVAFNPLTRARDFSGVQVFVLFVLTMLITVIPIIAYPLPPLEDYVNHLSRMHVIADIGHNPNLARFYEIDWEIVPNLMMDLIVPLFARFMNVYVAGQLFLISIFVLIVSGGLVLNRALFGRWSVLPLITAPFVYNDVFLVGVANYQFGIGLALWALACWAVLRRSFAPLRFLASAGFVVALFFCHLFALGVYGVGLLAYECWRLFADTERAPRARARSFLAAGLPFLTAVPLLLKSPTWGQADDFSWESSGKIDGLFYIIQLYSDVIALSLAVVLALSVVWVVRRGLLKAHPLFLSLLCVGSLVYMALPRVMFSTYLADQRLPVALAFMLVACLQIELRQRTVRRAFLAILMLTTIVRVIEVDVVWAQLSPESAAMRLSAKRIAPGSRVLVSYADPAAGDELRDFGLVHGACMAIIERSALVTTAFTVEGKQIMHVRPPYRSQVDTEDGTPPSAAELALAALKPESAEDKYWRDWPNQFDYVYLIFTEDDQPNPAPDVLNLVYDGDRFQLYKIIKPKPRPN